MINFSIFEFHHWRSQRYSYQINVSYLKRLTYGDFERWPNTHESIHQALLTTIVLVFAMSAIIPTVTKKGYIYTRTVQTRVLVPFARAVALIGAVITLHGSIASGISFYAHSTSAFMFISHANWACHNRAPQPYKYTSKGVIINMSPFLVSLK